MSDEPGPAPFPVTARALLFALVRVEKRIMINQLERTSASRRLRSPVRISQSVDVLSKPFAVKLTKSQAVDLLDWLENHDRKPIAMNFDRVGWYTVSF
jgi:hypothetical protein